MYILHIITINITNTGYKVRNTVKHQYFFIIDDHHTTPMLIPERILAFSATYSVVGIQSITQTNRANLRQAGGVAAKLCARSWFLASV